MIKKSVSQKAVRTPGQPASQPSTYTSIPLSRPCRKSFSQPYLGQAVTGSQFNTLLCYPATQIRHPAVSQTYSSPQSRKAELRIKRAVKSISYLALSDQAVNQPSSFCLQHLNTGFTSAMCSSPSVFSPHSAESPTGPESEVCCCCHTATSGSPLDPQHTHPRALLSHLNTHEIHL